MLLLVTFLATKLDTTQLVFSLKCHKGKISSILLYRAYQQNNRFPIIRISHPPKWKWNSTRLLEETSQRGCPTFCLASFLISGFDIGWSSSNGRASEINSALPRGGWVTWKLKVLDITYYRSWNTCLWNNQETHALGFSSMPRRTNRQLLQMSNWTNQW